MVKYVDYEKVNRSKIVALRERLAEATTLGNNILASLPILPPADQVNPTMMITGESSLAKVELAIKNYGTKVSEVIKQAKGVHQNFKDALTTAEFRKP